MNETLQLVNIALTSGVLAALIGAAVAYGKLTQKVDNQHERLEGHERDIEALWKANHSTNEKMFLISKRGDR